MFAAESSSTAAATDPIHHPTDSEESFLPSAKKRKLSYTRRHSTSASQLSPESMSDSEEPRKRPTTAEERALGSEKNMVIAMSTNDQAGGQTVAPFLAKHIPDSYAPQGPMLSSTRNKDPNTKFCYRHRPDLKCRRQADELTMGHLQRELETLSQGDQQAIAHVWSLFSAAPNKHRNLILQGILTQCCFPQLSFLSASVRDLIRIDFISALPAELSFKILCYLDTTSLCKAAQVSRRWRLLADDDVVWHRMCEQHIDRKCTKCGWGLPLLERKMLRASKRQIQLRATGQASENPAQAVSSYPAAGTAQASSGVPSRLPSPDSASPDAKDAPSSTDVVARCGLSNSAKADYFAPKSILRRPWKDVYKDRFKVGTNWKYGRCSLKVFKGHANGVMCLQFDDNILATGSYDSTIKIWDIKTGEELRTLKGHASGIRCLQFDDSKLISGSIDHSLKVWNWRTGDCLSTYTGHLGPVISLHFDNSILASGSVDHTVKIWNFEEKCTTILRGHTDWVNSVKVDAESRTVFSASDDCTVRLWDLDTKQCLRVFEGHVGQVQQVVCLPSEFELDDEVADANYDSDGSISPGHHSATHNQQPTPLTLSPYGDTFDSNARAPPPRYILSGALDSTIRLWETSTGRCLRTFFGHVEGVWGLAADTLRVVSGSQDRMVKVWDPRTGKCERTFTGHTSPITCVGLSDSRICTGSEDCEVRMYSFTA